MSDLCHWAAERRYLLQITGISLTCMLLTAYASTFVLRNIQSPLNDLGIIVCGAIIGYLVFLAGERVWAKELDQELNRLLDLEEGED